jgi:O-antigen/teichoic acid export membrane protein
LGTTLLLSTALGVEVFGSYTFAITIVTLVSVFSPLGLDMGAVYFGAQYHKKEPQKHRSIIINGFLITSFSGLFFATGLWFCADFFTDPQPIRAIAPALLFWNPLLFSVGVLRSIKDMKGNAIVFQIIPSLGLLIGAVLTVTLSLSLFEAILFFIVSIVLSAGSGLHRVWKKLGALLSDKSQPNEYDLGAQLRYSIPQSLAAMTFRLTIWTDIIMIGIMSTDRELGLYRIASALAIMGALPVSALSTIFNPIISQKVGEKAWIELNKTLKTITRWLMSLSLPILCAMFFLPDLLLWMFGSEYQESTTPLLILIGGQFLWISCSMAMRLIPMSGHSTLTLINGIIAASLNIILNAWLIPKYGAIGAAISTSTTLALWSLWRLVEIWHLMRCFPFSKVTFLLFGIAISITLGLYPLLISLSLWIRIPLVTVISSSFLYFAFQIGAEDADVEIKELLLSKFRKRSSK